MTTYIIKRLFLMIPTLFVISLIIFMVLNLAPGRPGGGAMGGEGMESAQSQEARESYRIFKEQFNFDKPILVNTRYALSSEEVLVELRHLVRYRAPECNEDGAPEGCVSGDEKPPIEEVIEAQDILEDWGQYAVPHLLEIAGDDAQSLEVRRLAVTYLSTSAKRRLINEYGRNQTPEERQLNREISNENERVGSWTVAPDAGADAIDELLASKWQPWFEEHRERFEYDAGEKVAIFFTDTRFAKYWGNLLRFDFGVSHVDKQPVIEKIAQKVPYTLTINFLAIFFAYVVSVPLGVWSAYRQNTMADRVVTVILFLLYSLPSFFVAVLLVEFFTQGRPFEILPTSDFVGQFPDWYSPGHAVETTDDLTLIEYLLSVSYHLVLPVFCLTYGALASLSRYARTGLLDVIRADYIRTARAKGLGEPMVIIKHAVRNGMIPVLTLLGTLLPALIGGSVIIEYIFNIPGMGLLIFDAIMARDYNVIMGVLLVSTLLTLVGLLISDISYAIVDPRISFD